MFEKFKGLFTVIKGKKPNLIETKTDNSQIYLSAEYLRTNKNIQYADTFAVDKKYICNENDLLIIWDGSNSGEVFIGKSGLLSSTMAKLKFNDKYLNKYLYYFLKSKFNILNANVKGAAIPHLNRNTLDNLEIYCATLAEQQEIVKVLDTMNDIIRLREECISHAQELIPALFQEMFGNPIKNDKNYKTYAIKSLGKVTTGTTPPSSKENMFGGNIPFVTPGDLETENGKYNRYLTEEGSLNSRMVRAGSTLVCCIGATIGKVDMVRIRSCFNQQINAIEWNNEDINDVYALYLFRLLAPLIKEKASNTTLPILNKRNFENIFIPKPDIKIQEIFAQKAIEIESYIKEQNDELKNAKQMFQSLLHHAFTGELTKHKNGEINE